MSVNWKFEANKEQGDIFCPHCSDLRDTPYFTSGTDVICIRCVRVLSKAFEMYGAEARQETRQTLRDGQYPVSRVKAELAAGIYYDDTQRIDEMNTAEDYNRFEENQIALDNDMYDD